MRALPGGSRGPELLAGHAQSDYDGKPAAFRAMVAALKKAASRLDDEERMKRLPRGFEDVTDVRTSAQAIRNRHFVVRHNFDPAAIHSPALVDELVDFTLRAKPLLDWGRAIEGRAG